MPSRLFRESISVVVGKILRCLGFGGFQEKELNRLKKAKLAAKARLSFVGEDEEEVEEEGAEDQEVCWL